MKSRTRSPAGFARNCVTLLGLTAFLVSNAAMGVVINFEDPSCTGAGGAIGNQYDCLGITFNHQWVVDFSATPGFAHSGSSAIQLCYGAEFCTVPLEMEFTKHQTQVKVWVGFAGALDSPQWVVIQGYNGQIQIPGVQSVAMLPASGSGTPVNTSLVVSDPLARITGVAVGFLGAEATPPQIYNNKLVVDDVEFEQGPPPPCLATGPPELALAQPAPDSSQSVPFNQFLLQGTPDSGGDPWAQITLSVTGPGPATRTWTIDSGSFFGNNYATAVSDCLYPGHNLITVTLQNCLGSSHSSATIDYNPIDPSTRIEVMGIEITQTIQDLNNSVPLIAGKRTFARVYLRTQGPTATISNVRGYLSACRPYPATTFCQSYLGTIQSLKTMTVDASSDVTAMRRDLTKSLNFELPPDWIAAGNLHVEFSFDVNGESLGLQCDGCDNLATGPLTGWPFLRYVSFQSAPRVSLTIIKMNYNQNGGFFSPTDVDVSKLPSLLRRMYPTALVDSQAASWLEFPHGLPPDKTDLGPPIVWSRWDIMNYDLTIARWSQSLHYGGRGYDPLTRYYGMIVYMYEPGDDTDGQELCTEGDCSSRVASGATAPNTGAHELGHSYGRSHTPGCPNTPDTDSNYPFPGGQIGNSSDFFGFDFGDATLAIGRRVLDPSSTYDVMSYCSGTKWISSYTYQGILNKMSSESPSSALLLQSRAGPKSLGDYLLINGVLNPTNGAISLFPFWRLPDAPPSDLPTASDFSIVLMDSQTNVLANYPFQPGADEEGILGKATLSEVVPFVPGTVRIVISRLGQELASRTVSSNMPVVTNVVVGLNTNGSNALFWTASDADSTNLWYVVQYSPTGTNWLTLAVDLQQPELDLDWELLPGSPVGKFRVLATDGVNTGIGYSQQSYSVPNKAPSAQIISPENGSAFTSSQTIVLVGEATDLEDVDLGDTALVWSSSLQGPLGTGAMISVNGLMPGTHTITLTATDSGGATGTATVQIQVAAQLDVADAGPDRTVAVGSPVQLDATHSSGVGPLTYGWQFIAAPQGSQSSLANRTAAQTSFTPDVAGTYELLLAVKDSLGGGAMTRLTVTALDSNSLGSFCYTQLPALSQGVDVWDSSAFPPGTTNGPWVLADDFICTNAGAIAEIDLWGSWLSDRSATNTLTFWLGIYDDVPISATNSYSHPGNLISQQYFQPGEYLEQVWATGSEYFADPGPYEYGNVIGSDTQVWYYRFLPTQFFQTLTNGRIYWLSVFAQAPTGTTNVFGWKTTINVQHDVSVHAPWPGAAPTTNGWLRNYIQIPVYNYLDLAFRISTTNPPTIYPPPCCAEGNGVKYLQRPAVTNGTDWNATFSPLDFNSVPWVLADDFPCTVTGPVTDIHLWGSWMGDVVDTNAAFTLSVWSDVASNSTSGYSHPGQLLWTQSFTNGQYTFCLYTNKTETFDDFFGLGPLGSSSNLYYFCFYPPATNTFVQTGSPTAKTNYWLSVSVVAHGNSLFGWKSSVDSYNDIAVAGVDGQFYPTNWNPSTWLGVGKVSLSFKINTETNQCPTPQLLCSDMALACGDYSYTNSPLCFDCTCTNTAVSLIGSTVTNSGCIQTITQTWRVYDPCCGLSNSCNRVVTILPTGPIVACSNLTFLCSSGNLTNPPAVLDSCCTNVNVTLISTNLVVFGCSNIYFQTWQAVDPCCNLTNTCSRTVTVISPGTLQMLCSNLAITCGNPIPTNPPPYTNPCCPSVTVTQLSSTTVTNGCGRTIYRVWQATDCCTNTVVCTQVVSVLPPAGFAIVVPNTNTIAFGNANLTYPFNANVHYQQVYVSNQFGAMPAGGALITALAFRVGQSFPAFSATTLPSIGISLSTTPKQPGGLDTVLANNVGTDNTLVFSGPLTLSSAKNGFDVIIPLTRAFPYNPALGNLLLNISNTVGAAASPFDAVLTTGGSVSRGDGSPYNTGTASETNWIGLVTEFILGPPLQLLCSNLTITCGSPVPTNPPAYLDYCCTNVTVTLLGTITNNPGCSPTLLQNWQASDCCGNVTNCTRTVTVLPSAPTLLCSNLTVACTDFSYTNPPSYIDLCCTNVSLSLVTNLSGGSSCSQSITQTWRAVDLCCFTTNFCTRTITVTGVPPSFSVCSNIVVKTCGTNVLVTWPTNATSPCSSVTVTSSPPSGTTFAAPSTNNVTIKAWDTCGHTNTCTFTVTVTRPVLGILSVTYLTPNVTLHWTDGILQQSTNVAGPYLDVPLAAPPAYMTGATNRATFYRLRCTSP